MTSHGVERTQGLAASPRKVRGHSRFCYGPFPVGSATKRAKAHHGADSSSKVLRHLQRTGDSLMLDHVGTDADKTAQLILKMAPLKEIHGVTLRTYKTISTRLCTTEPKCTRFRKTRRLARPSYPSSGEILI